MIDDIKTNSQRGSVNIGAKVGLQDSKFGGFDDLTTTTLNNLKGTRAVQKRHIENLVKMPQIKQAEKDILNKVLAEYEGEIIPVQEFADKVKTYLLPLNRGKNSYSRWESIHMDENLRGDVRNYSENIYESPLKTQGAVHHFSEDDFPNYFAHTRTEDVDSGYIYPDQEAITKHLADFEADLGIKTIDHNGRTQYTTIRKSDGERIGAYYDTEEEAIAAAKKYEPDNARHRLKTEVPAKTRRIVEMQSDLFQRGRLEREIPTVKTIEAELEPDVRDLKYNEENIDKYKRFLELMEDGVFEKEGIPFRAADEDQYGYWEKYFKDWKPTPEQLAELKPRIDAGEISQGGMGFEGQYGFKNYLEAKYGIDHSFWNYIPEWSNKQEAIAFTKGKVESMTEKMATLKQRVGDMQKQIENFTLTPEQQLKKDKLDPYKNTWHQRVLREEIKKAAEDGITELQVPTGKTAAQIEGYIGGEGYVPRNAEVGDTFDYGGETMLIIKDYGDDVDAVPDSAVMNEFDFYDAKQDEVNNFLADFDYNGYDIKEALSTSSIGDDVFQDGQKLANKIFDETGSYPDEDDYVQIAKELESKYSDIKDRIAERVIDERYPDADAYAEYASDNFGTKYIHTGDDNIIQMDEGFLGDSENFTKGVTDDMDADEVRDNLSEEQQRVFDFYEKDIPKYLKKLYPNIERIFDDNGVEWWQLPIDPGKAKEPVDAFAKKKEEEDQPQPVYA